MVITIGGFTTGRRPFAVDHLYRLTIEVEATAFGEVVHFAAQREGFGYELDRPLELVPVKDVAERGFQRGENWLLHFAGW
ncbi:hypothetical protein [Nocardia salmonicida]|uniref:hypothetical protein n=1 Tax=Nocardia salmonicida TaxID=53431 RepID=UPI0033D53792